MYDTVASCVTLSVSPSLCHPLCVGATLWQSRNSRSWWQRLWQESREADSLWSTRSLVSLKRGPHIYLICLTHLGLLVCLFFYYSIDICVRCPFISPSQTVPHNSVKSLPLSSEEKRKNRYRNVLPSTPTLPLFSHPHGSMHAPYIGPLLLISITS